MPPEQRPGMDREHSSARPSALARAYTEIDRLHAIRDEFGEPADLRRKVDELTAERDRLRAALELIASTNPVDAALDPDRALRVAAEALAGSCPPTSSASSLPDGFDSAGSCPPTQPTNEGADA